MKPFTRFSSVTPKTDLSRLDFNWHEKDLPERERTKHVHRLHPYLGKYVPQLVEVFLRKYARRAVLDPFSGSGTTLVEASTLGFDAVGVDVSLFNCLLAKVKTAVYDIDALEQEARELWWDYTRALDERSPSGPAGSYLRKWLHPQSLRELLLFRELIAGRDHEDLFKIVLCRSARSARLAPHHELDFPKEPVSGAYHCRKHARLCRPTQGAAKFLRRYLEDTLERVRAYARLRKPVSVKLLHGDARTLRLPAIDTVMTSPPYVGLIDYHEQHRYAYELLGLPRHDGSEIGPASRGSTKRAKADYLEGIAAVFANCARRMEKGAHAVIVVGDKHDLYRDLHRDCGFRLVERFERHVNRRTGLRSHDFYESILVWRR